MTADDLSAALGVAKSTLSGKAKQVRDLLKMSWGTPEFLREDMIEASPVIWYIQVDGLIVDARALPLQIQVQAFELGAIPYIDRVLTAWFWKGQVLRCRPAVDPDALARWEAVLEPWRQRALAASAYLAAAPGPGRG